MLQTLIKKIMPKTYQRIRAYRLDDFMDVIAAAEKRERDRLIELLLDLDVIRRDALGHLVAFNTHGTEVIYLEGLEPND